MRKHKKVMPGYADAERIGNAARAALSDLVNDMPFWEGLSAAEMTKRTEKRLEKICNNLKRSFRDSYEKVDCER
jgi:hypothetical protein